MNELRLSGTLVADCENRVYGAKCNVGRYILRVTQYSPAFRVDVIPVILFNPPEDVIGLREGDMVDVLGEVHARPESDDEGRYTRLVVVANQITLKGGNL